MSKTPTLIRVLCSEENDPLRRQSSLLDQRVNSAAARNAIPPQ